MLNNLAIAYVMYCGCLNCYFTSYNDKACVHGSTIGTNGRPISFKVLPMVPLVIPLVPMVPLVKTDGANIADNLQCGQNYQHLKVT